jgi:hypothetical protein
LLVVAALSSLLVISGCDIFGTHKKVQVPQLLLPLQSANRDRLIQEVNRLSTVKSIHGKVDIEFEDTSFASVGIAEKYRQVDGTVTLQRPGKIYLVIQFTFVDIAQMASDGEHFSVAVLKGDDKYRRFVKGTNSAVYSKLDTDGNRPARNGNGQKAEKETVRSLSNLRPQHLTDAFMIRPIDSNGSLVYAQSEFFQEEADTRPQARKGSRIMRGYYLLEEFSDSRDGLRLSRRFWFDRVNGIRLARIQTYDDRGVLVTDVSYSSEKPLGVPAAATLPTTIELTRPQDQYKIRISYQDPNTVDLNKEYPPEAFVLLNKWQLPEVDLDAGTNKKISINH